MNSLTQLDDQIRAHWDAVYTLDRLINKALTSNLAPKLTKEIDFFYF